MQEAVMDWIAAGRGVGMSSRTMALWLAFDRKDDPHGFGPSHPHDPDDLDKYGEPLAVAAFLRDLFTPPGTGSPPRR